MTTVATWSTPRFLGKQHIAPFQHFGFVHLNYKIHRVLLPAVMDCIEIFNGFLPSSRVPPTLRLLAVAAFLFYFSHESLAVIASESSSPTPSGTVDTEIIQLSWTRCFTL